MKVLELEDNEENKSHVLAMVHHKSGGAKEEERQGRKVVSVLQ